MISVRALEKRYPGAARPTLGGVTFEVGAGRLVAVFGRSGAGKSTLLRCLGGLEPFDAGSIGIDGVVAQARGAAAVVRGLRGRVGLVSQALDLFPHLTVVENCLLAPRVVRREDPALARERAARLLARLGVEEKSDAYPDQLSGGQRQRVAIARAMMMDPVVLLLDEPTSSLDPSLKAEVRRTLLTIRESGVTQVVVTHDVELVRSTADWVLVMEGGTIVREGEPQSVVA